MKTKVGILGVKISAFLELGLGSLGEQIPNLFNPLAEMPLKFGSIRCGELRFPAAAGGVQDEKQGNPDS